MMNPPLAIVAAIALPLLGAPLIALLGSRPNLREAATLVTGGILFLVVLSLAPEILAGARPEIQLLDILPGLTLTRLWPFRRPLDNPTLRVDPTYRV